MSKRLIYTLLSVSLFFSQNLSQPRVSPAAEVKQTIGLSTIAINYSRPLVRGRKIYGTPLAPYGWTKRAFGNGKPSPWRAGANENTTFEISDDALINGKKLPAGKYGFSIVLNQSQWTLIFNKQNSNWGHFFYNEDADALRINVNPTTSSHREALMYYIDNITPNSATVYMEWEKKQVSFKVEFDHHEVILASFRNELRTIPGFNAGWAQAANYCLQNNINHQEALQWIDYAINNIGVTTFNNYYTKSALLEQIGKTKEAEAVLAAVLPNATEANMNFYGYQLLGQKKFKKAIEVFTSNTEKYPNSWNTYDSLGDAYGQSGDKAQSLKLYKKAFSMAPDNQKNRIQQIISNLEN